MSASPPIVSGGRGPSWRLVAVHVGQTLAMFVVIVRTGLEDRTLQWELPGYPEYARQVRYRLFPGVW